MRKAASRAVGVSAARRGCAYGVKEEQEGCTACTAGMLGTAAEAAAQAARSAGSSTWGAVLAKPDLVLVPPPFVACTGQHGAGEERFCSRVVGRVRCTRGGTMHSTMHAALPNREAAYREAAHHDIVRLLLPAHVWCSYHRPKRCN